MRSLRTRSLNTDVPRAEGYLGQYLVIFPEDRLVAVRMVESFPGYDPERDGFADFQELAAELVR